jgi:tetratricopeptide (TPR) repeat protein
VVRDRGWQPYAPATPILWFQSAPLLSRLSLGFQNLIADFYWMRAVVYYGGLRRASGPTRNYELLDPLLTFVTTLDPRFKVAYRFGAIFLTEGYPNGPGRPDRAIALLERGIQANPNAWEYMHDIGFVYYWWFQDFTSAAKWFEKAGQVPGAADWLPALAAYTLAEGGDRQSSRFLWQRLRDSSDADWLRRNAERSLAQIDAMDAIDQLTEASRRFSARVGRPPRDWRELADSEQWRGLPLDPTGVPYDLDAATGRIAVSTHSQLWPMPTLKAASPGAAVR